MSDFAKAPATEQELAVIDRYWRAANYLSACQLYLLDNPLLRRPLHLTPVEQASARRASICSWEPSIQTISSGQVRAADSSTNFKTDLFEVKGLLAIIYLL